MSKFRIKLKLTGLELEVEGAREDVPLLSKNIGAQLGNLIAPAAAIADGKLLSSQREPIDITPRESASGSGSGRRGRRANTGGGGGGGGGSSAAAVDFRHDPSGFGSPQQTWNTATKAIWLLYVSEKQGGPKEMAAPQIANTFNKHFKQAGKITPNNTSRDFGRLKSKAPAQVSDDTTKDPAVWFLTDAGYKRAEQLVVEARGGAAAVE